MKMHETMRLINLLDFSPKDENEIIYKLVITYIQSQLQEDEFVISHKTYTGSYVKEEESPTTHRTFWYSHRAENGGFYHALTFHLPTSDNPFVRISPAVNYGLKDKNFPLIDPDGVDLKAFVRQIFDILKKEQNRKPWSRIFAS